MSTLNEERILHLTRRKTLEEVAVLIDQGHDVGLTLQQFQKGFLTIFADDLDSTKDKELREQVRKQMGLA